VKLKVVLAVLDVKAGRCDAAKLVEELVLALY